jgi:hypothetical protein
MAWAAILPMASKETKVHRTVRYVNSNDGLLTAHNVHYNGLKMFINLVFSFQVF